MTSAGGCAVHDRRL